MEVKVTSKQERYDRIIINVTQSGQNRMWTTWLYVQQGCGYPLPTNVMPMQQTAPTAEIAIALGKAWVTRHLPVTVSRYGRHYLRIQLWWNDSEWHYIINSLGPTGGESVKGGFPSKEAARKAGEARLIELHQQDQGEQDERQ